MSVLENLLWWYLFRAINPVSTSATKQNIARNPITCKMTEKVQVYHAGLLVLTTDSSK